MPGVVVVVVVEWLCNKIRRRYRFKAVQRQYSRSFSIPCTIYTLYTVVWRSTHVLTVRRAGEIIMKAFWGISISFSLSHFWSKPWFSFTFRFWFYYVNQVWKAEPNTINAATEPPKKNGRTDIAIQVEKRIWFSLSWTWVCANQIIIIDSDDKLSGTIFFLRCHFCLYLAWTSTMSDTTIVRFMFLFYIECSR